MTAKTDLSAMVRFGFLTMPNYSMIAATAAIEACRMANYIADRAIYQWQVVTLSGEPAVASNGLWMGETHALADMERPDVVFVCGGVSIRQATGLRLLEELRRLARRDIALGSLCTGSYALAQAGLLDGYRCAIHWESLPAISEEFPDISFVDDIFVVDRDRLTCTGGNAPTYLMARLIEARLGSEVTRGISEQFILERLRGGAESQRPFAKGQERLHPALQEAARLMKRTLNAPLAITAIAQRVGLSSRQLERLFQQHARVSPAEYYMALRLAHARLLLRQSSMKVTAVGMACGFVSSAHFSSSYRRHYGYAPRAERQPHDYRPSEALEGVS
ncbi:GlxA family transcriptional regulator [Aureimonas fodinaquatilis]|uniref:GlxA family transcriptional regulator n=1 Tax=Aureimonas fodinaquatilis TaxID=2565783 RepID=A0A5B0E2I7_9HYPH|nr:GlxA family transcriptional regulator [Aureimonas fodinaquatilis]KAA0972542.1 GlxA family transcriptional regulator [Aureimonas fodinaquatilis]